MRDKLRDDSDPLVIRPTADVVGGAGRWSSISDVGNNLHWLRAKSENCFLFTTRLIRLRDDEPSHGRINVDVRAAKGVGDRALSVPKIAAKKAAGVFGWPAPGHNAGRTYTMTA